MGLREDKAARTRQGLIEAAVLLAAQRSLHQVTVDDIAAAAGVSRRTFFNYFDSKEAALSAGLDRSAELIDAIGARPADERPWQAMTAAVLAAFAEDSPQLPERLRDLYTDPTMLPLTTANRARAERGVAEALCRRDPGLSIGKARLMAAVFLVSVRSVSQLWLESRDPRPLRPLIEQALGGVGAGLADW